MHRAAISGRVGWSGSLGRLLVAAALLCRAAFGLPTPAAAAAQGPAVAQQSAPVEVQGAWARATPPGAATGAIYLTLTSPSGDTLTSVSSPAAREASLHGMRMEGPVMRMRPVEGGLDLPAGKPVTLAPGGYHIMLDGLKAPLKPGQAVPLHLTFRKAPPLNVQAQVQPIGASGPGGAEPGRPVVR